MSKKILVVEDSEMLRNLFMRTLKSAGYEVETAEHGREGMILVKQMSFDLIFTDLNMPLMDGIEFTALVRQSADNSETPVIIVSSDAAIPRKSAAKEAGATGWITKPFSKEKIIGQIEHFLS